MSAAVPSLLLGAAVAIGMGLPAPRPAVLRTPGVSLRRPSTLVVGSAVSLVLVVPLGIVGAAVGGFLAGAADRAWTARQRSRSRQLERSGATEAMSVLGAELRAGRPPAVALERAGQVCVGPCGLALREAAAATELGGSPQEVFTRHAPSSAVPALLRGLAVCWQVCHSTGSSLAVAVDRLADAVRAEQTVYDEVQAELAGPRATAQLVCALPLVVLAAACGLGGHPFGFLLHTPVGEACLVVGIGLDLLGLWATRRLVASAGGEA